MCLGGGLDSLGALGHSVLGELGGEDEADGGLDLSGAEGALLVGADKDGGGPSGAGGGGAAGPGAMPGGFGEAASAAASSDITLQAPVTLSIVLIAVGLAVLGGLLAGAFGGWWPIR